MIVLVGFMCAGKTSVGRSLAARLGLPFVDTDEAVERAAGASVAAIFEHRGEEGFRALEREVVEKVLAGADAVVALGGGAVESATVRDLLGERQVVHLALGPDEALRRAGDASSRPMLRLYDARALHTRRTPLYEALADVTVGVEGRSVDGVVDEILSRLRNIEASRR